MKRSTCLLGVLFLAATCGAQTGQVQQSTGTLEQTFESGLAFQRKAASATTPSEALDYLQKAIGQYQETVRLRADFFPAQAMWADCLQELVHRRPEPQQRRALLQATQEHYAAAAQCTGATWKLYHDWARFLATDVADAATGAQERCAALRQATAVIKKGLELATFSGDRAKLECLWGMCSFRLAEETRDPGQQRDLYHQATAKFEGATHVESEAKTARTYSVWGLALLRLAKLDRDRLLIHQAIERLVTSLDKDPDQPDVHYNLACAYALAGQPKLALQHLRACLEHDDPQHKFQTAAANDPDLGSLWREPEVREMFEPPTPPSGGPPPNR